MRWAIWYHLYDLKNVKNTHGGVLIWYQIAQRITFMNLENWLVYGIYEPALPKIFKSKLTFSEFSVNTQKISNSLTNLIFFGK